MIKVCEVSRKCIMLFTHNNRYLALTGLLTFLQWTIQPAPNGISEIFHEIFPEILHAKKFHEILHHYLCVVYCAAATGGSPVRYLPHSDINTWTNLWFIYTFCGNELSILAWSHIFHHCLFDCAAFSFFAFLVAPWILVLHYQSWVGFPPRGSRSPIPGGRGPRAFFNPETRGF